LGSIDDSVRGRLQALFFRRAAFSLDFPQLLQIGLRFAMQAAFVDREQVEARRIFDEAAGGA